MPAFVTGFSSNNPVSRGIRRGICCRCLPDACSASPIKLGEMRKTKLYQSCHASRPRSCRRSHRRRGITSACAEQTNGSTTDAPRRRDHLRVCGADTRFGSPDGTVTGSPPRVRSRPQAAGAPVASAGITSACAEQTNPPYAPDADCRGSPPRVRSRRERGTPHAVDAGITSACAEQTERGWSCDDGKSRQYGSPPRVRSRRRWWSCGRLLAGITSACAEQTSLMVGLSANARDHLRVCGADRVNLPVGFPPLGSPPRVRSRPDQSGVGRRLRGITSACAEQTPIAPIGCARSRDHLRVCGADRDGHEPRPRGRGSPPRVRSRLQRHRELVRREGITSACAEQTITRTATGT